MDEVEGMYINVMKVMKLHSEVIVNFDRFGDSVRWFKEELSKIEHFQSSEYIFLGKYLLDVLKLIIL